MYKDREALRPLIVNLARYFGGAEARVLDLATTMGRGACGVACLRGSPLAERLTAAGLEPLELAGDKTDPRLALILARAVDENGYNLVDAHNVQSHFWAYAARRWTHRPPALVATVHSSIREEHRGRMKGEIYERLERWLLPRFDQIITVAGYLCLELRQWCMACERVALVPNGIRQNASPPAAPKAVRQELRLAPGDKVVGTVGRLEPAKGQYVLIEAVEKLAPTWPGLKCVIVGEGHLDAPLRNLAARRGMGGRVLFTGFRSDVPRLLEAFDIFALPSLTEGTPIALLEACRSARPVVASRVGGVPDVISDGRSGLLVSPGDPAALADAIDGLLRNELAARQMGWQAAADVAEQYSLERMVCRTWEAYEAALARREVART